MKQLQSDRGICFALRRIAVNFDEEQFQLTHDKRNGIRTTKASMGRGIILKTTPLEFEEWLAELSTAIQLFAEAATLSQALIWQNLFDPLASFDVSGQFGLSIPSPAPSTSCYATYCILPSSYHRKRVRTLLHK